MKREGKALVWDHYQKDIAEDKFFYLRSCIRQNFFPGSEGAFLKMMREDLQKDIYDDQNHTTCTGIGYYTDTLPLALSPSSSHSNHLTRVKCVPVNTAANSQGK